MKRLLLLIFSLMFYVNGWGQDPSFSQIDNALVYYHSSYAPIKGGINLSGAYRNQWSDVPGGFTTQFLHVDVKPAKKNTGFGINICNDIEGAAFIKTQRADLIVRQKCPIRYKIKKKELVSLTFGGYVGVQRKSLDWSKLVFSDEIDPVFGIYQNSSQLTPTILNSLFYDCGISVSGEFKFKLNEYRIPLDLHASLNHFISRGWESLQGLDTRLPRLFVITAATTIQKNSFYNIPLIKPTIQYEKQSTIHRIKCGSLVGYLDDRNDRSFYLGMYYSSFINTQYRGNAYSIIPAVGYEKVVGDFLIGVAYSHDMNLSGVNFSNVGPVHEITFAINAVTGDKKYKSKSNIFKKCADF